MKNSIQFLLLTAFSAFLFLGCTDKKKEERIIQEQVEKIEVIEDKIENTEQEIEVIKEEAEAALNELETL
jgi:outer membrane murein-binding lipoprotein Lpp